MTTAKDNWSSTTCPFGRLHIQEQYYATPPVNEYSGVLLTRPFNTLINPTVNPKDLSVKKTIMENILDFAKNIALSPKEKQLREAGLHDDNGNWTEDALAIISTKKAKQLGYRDQQEMVNKNGGKGCHYSVLEVNAMFIEFADELQDIAKKFVDSKNK